jgi:hypothetical protein
VRVRLPPRSPNNLYTGEEKMGSKWGGEIFSPHKHVTTWIGGKMIKGTPTPRTNALRVALRKARTHERLVNITAEVFLELQKMEQKLNTYKAVRSKQMPITYERFTELVRDLAACQEKLERAEKHIKTLEREMRDGTRDAAAEQRWKDVQGDEYGSY